MGDSKVRNENYIVIQGWMRNDLNLKGNELLVYAVIYGFSQKENQWFEGSRQYLADWAGATRQGIDKNLKSLLEKGLIEKQENIINNVKFVCYRATEFTGDDNSVYRGGQQSLQGVETEFTGGCKQSLPNNIDDKVIEKNYRGNNRYKDPVDENFELLWSLYPRKKGKNSVSKKAKKEAYKIGYDHMARAIDRYAKENDKTDPQYIMYGSSFFNTGYVDYLDENYEPPKNSTEDAILRFLQRGD